MQGSTTDSQAFDAGQRALLERIANGAPLPELLEGVVRLIERQACGMLCSILLVDVEQQCIRPGAAPSLPPEYTQALDGAKIGPHEGTCGAAASRAERVVVVDIATHPNWENHRQIALPHGLRACWSSPIFSPSREVLGTFAMYYTQTRGPTDQEIAWVSIATHLASIAILRDRSEQSLRTSEARYRKLARLYAVSSAVGEAMLHMQEPQALYDLACQLAVDHGLARLAWIGLRDAVSGEIMPVARAGHDTGYIDRVSATLTKPDIDRGPAGRALQSGRYAVSNDIASDPAFHWKAEALTRGFQSCAVFPFLMHDARPGILALYAEQRDSFGADELRVLAALAADIAFVVESAVNKRENRRLVRDLSERVKELTMMHRVARVLQEERPVDRALLTEIVSMFPAAFEHVALCEARISWSSIVVQTKGFVSSPWQLTATFQAAEQQGEIVVVYRSTPPEGPDKTFLPEEQQLIRSIADMLAAQLGRKHSKDALRQSEERVRAVIQHTPNVGIQWFDAQGRVLFVNHTSRRLFGWEQIDALGKTLDQLNFSADEAARFGALLRRVVDTGAPVGPEEFRFTHPDGRPGVLLSTIFRIPYSNSDFCYVCMDVDLTDYKRMEQDVRAGEKQRALIYSSVTDMIFYLAVEPDERYRFLSANPAFLQVAGLVESDVVGKTMQEVVPRQPRTLALTKYREAIELRRPVSWEAIIHLPGGTRYGDVTVAPIFDQAGRCTNLVGTIHDVTARRSEEEERRQLQFQLHQSQRLQSLGTLAGGIAHDFNNILAAIFGHIDLLKLGRPDATQISESVSEIDKAARRASDLVRRILMFSRRQEPEREVLSLPVVIEEALQLLRAGLPRTLKIRSRFAPDAPHVSADATQVHQIVMNLGTNAAHAMEGRQGVIDVTLDAFDVDGAAAASLPSLAEGRYARLQVSDQGCGMDQATMARAFEPFFTTKTAGHGTGLGLSMVHGIMKSHQGTVTLHSKPEHGTRFELYFPAAIGEPVHVAAPPEAASHGCGEHILYVDDDEALVLLGTRMLRRLGYRVTGISDPAQALAAFREHGQDFDAVVTDLSMPGLTGTELAKEIKQLRPDTRVLMVSGYVTPEDLKAAAAVGIEEVTLKPRTVEAFAQTLHQLVSKDRKT